MRNLRKFWATLTLAFATLTVLNALGVIGPPAPSVTTVMYVLIAYFCATRIGPP